MSFKTTSHIVCGKAITHYNITFLQNQVEDLFHYCRTLNGDGLHIVNSAFKKLGFNLNDVLSQLPDSFCCRQIFCNDYVLLDCSYDHTPYRVKKTRTCKGVFELFVVPTTGKRLGFWVPEKCCVKVNK